MTARYIVDEQPTVRVLDTAYCYRVVKEYGRPSTNRGGGGWSRKRLRDAVELADRLNAKEAA